VGIEMVTRRVQTRLERKCTAPEERLVVTRRPLADDSPAEGTSSPGATEQDEHYRYQYYLTPTWVSGVALEEPSLADIAPVNAYHHVSYAERYSRYTVESEKFFV